jgi:hypothetical protein
VFYSNHKLYQIFPGTAAKPLKEGKHGTYSVCTPNGVPRQSAQISLKLVEEKFDYYTRPLKQVVPPSKRQPSTEELIDSSSSDDSPTPPPYRPPDYTPLLNSLALSLKKISETLTQVLAEVTDIRTWELHD